MPIQTDPAEIEVEETVRKTVTADKLHILKLTISDPTKEKPAIELQVVPYAEDAEGNKQFSTVIQTIRTIDLYAAIANLLGAGPTKTADAMVAVFGAAAELVQYRMARLKELESASDNFSRLNKAYSDLRNTKDADPVEVENARVVATEAMKTVAEAGAAASDPANPRVK